VVEGMEKGFEIVKALITEGPMAAWEQLQEMAGEMKEAFVDAVKNWIKETIIVKAIEFIASLIIPGAGIIKAIIGIYDTVVFFIQKAKDIAQMVGNFLGSIGEIAMGNIGAAANALENGLATALTLVISFLAKLIHLDGVTAKIRAALNKIRGKVENMMAKVAKWIAEKANKLFKKNPGEKPKPGEKPDPEQTKEVADLKLKSPFQSVVKKKKEKHNLVVEITNGKPQLFVRSEITSYEEFIKNIEFDSDDSKALANKKAQEIDVELGKYKKTDQAKRKQWADDVVVKLNALADIIEKHSLSRGADKMPASVVRWDGTTSEGFGTGMTADILSVDYVKGEPAEEDPKNVYGWNLLQGIAQLAASGTSYYSVYIKGHILNDNLGGPANAYNLTPITQKANKAHLHNVEKKVKKLVIGMASDSDYERRNKTAEKVAFYQVKANYGTHPSRGITSFFTKKIQEAQNIQNPIERENQIEAATKIKMIHSHEESNLPLNFKCHWHQIEYNHTTQKWDQKVNGSEKEAQIDNTLPDNKQPYETLYEKLKNQ
jgi:hypothetical protein